MKAKTWAVKMWINSEKDWLNRKQDLNYREHLVRPALEEQLEDISLKNGIFVDLGCGDGIETFFLKQILEKHGFSEFYGFDINKSFIEKTQKNRELSKSIVFDYGELSDLIKQYELHERADLVTSLFVIQDEPCCKELIEVTQNYLKRKGVLMAVTVHPQFAEQLAGKGALKVRKEVKKSKKDDYLFAAEYPITEAGRPPFYVTYFQRELSCYVKLLEKYFYIENIKGLKPSKQVLAIAERGKISPFYEEKHNVYWPEISEMPSIVVIKGIKK